MKVTRPNGIVLDSNYEGYGINATYRLISFMIVDIAEASSNTNSIV